MKFSHMQNGIVPSAASPSQATFPFEPLACAGSAPRDGLYQVTTKYLCAGYVIRGGKLVACAPILRAKFNYWKTIAVRIGE